MCRNFVTDFLRHLVRPSNHRYSLALAARPEKGAKQRKSMARKYRLCDCSRDHEVPLTTETTMPNPTLRAGFCNSRQVQKWLSPVSVGTPAIAGEPFVAILAVASDRLRSCDWRLHDGYRRRGEIWLERGEAADDRQAVRIGEPANALDCPVARRPQVGARCNIGCPSVGTSPSSEPARA